MSVTDEGLAIVADLVPTDVLPAVRNQPCQVIPIFRTPTEVLPEVERLKYRLARGLDIPPTILGLPDVVEVGECAPADPAPGAVWYDTGAAPEPETGYVDRIAARAADIVATALEVNVRGTCGEPVGGIAWRRCMLAPGHLHTHLPVPSSRGLAVR